MSTDAYFALSRGIASAKAGERDEARYYFERALSSDPDTSQTCEIWFWLSEIASDPHEKRSALEEVLAVNPFDARARRSLAILDGKLDPGAMVDPDRPIQPAAPSPTADPQRFVCPNCGSRMTYTPDGQRLMCESCSSAERLKTQGASKSSGAGQDFVLAMATAAGHVHPESTRILTCKGCGAAFLLPPETISLTCPFCNSAYVVTEAESRDLVVPTSLVPFQIDSDAAREAFTDFQRQGKSQPLPPRGIYMPAWAFSLAGSVRWSCLRRSDRNWVSDSGDDYALEHDIPVAACAELKALYPVVITGFNLSVLTPFDPRYLSDWPAETYQISMGDASLNAREETVRQFHQKVAASLSGEIKDLRVVAPELAVDSYKLILLPFWTLATGDPERPYLWLNGQSGALINARMKEKFQSFIDRLFG
jgi:hypothetical protein